MKAVVLAVLVACGSSSPAQIDWQLDQLITHTVHHSHLVGLAAVVVDHGKIVLDRGYGFTDLDHKTPITADTVFEIGSLSKQFTAAAILRLADDGKLTLADRAAQYLPELPADLTLEQLMWQTSGIPDYAHGINIGKSPDELVHIIAQLPPDFPRGTQWAYSNSNYFLLGRIVEVVSKQPLGDYLRDHVLVHAGAPSIRICAPETAQARPTMVEGNKAVKGGDLDVRFYGGAGALCSSARDLIRWQDALFGGKVLSPAGLTAMTTPGKLADGTPIDYAGGLIADHLFAHARIWHNGGVPQGYESQLEWYPDDRLQIVLLTNTINTPPAATLGNLARALASEHLHIKPPEAPKPRDVAMTPDELAAYAGSYTKAPLTAVVTVAGTHLHVKVAGGVDDDLLAQGNGSFMLAKNPAVEYRFAGPRLEVYASGSKIATLIRP